jgi:hypothetical protein
MRARSINDRNFKASIQELKEAKDCLKLYYESTLPLGEAVVNVSGRRSSKFDDDDAVTSVVECNFT